MTARARSVVWQAVVVALVGAIGAAIAVQTAANLELRGIASGFGYLHRAAGFEISPGPVAYSSRDTYARALGVGLINTIRVSLLSVAIATALGLLIGVARLSTIRIVSTLSTMYVELMRNTPLLLQLLFWYAVSQALPDPRHALNPFPGVFLCFRGLYLPSLAGRPVFAGFDYHGGISISPEFAALVVGLSTCTAAFIGEIVRGGILAVGNGQTEAAASLGFSRGQRLWLIVFPQALRVIVPPTTSQFLNLVKNSSLAVAIGYPDLLSITSTTLNQTGQAIEAIALAAIVYLTISLTTSLLMNLGDRVAADV